VWDPAAAAPSAGFSGPRQPQWSAYNVTEEEDARGTGSSVQSSVVRATFRRRRDCHREWAIRPLPRRRAAGCV
jgi:hypothetical protein